MTAALLAPVIGSTQARVFTPPLPEHVNKRTGEILDRHSWGPDCIAFLEDVCGWDLLPWQKWLYMHALEKGARGQGFRFKIIIFLVARQQGKSMWLRGLGMWRLFLTEDGIPTPRAPAAKKVLIAAQNLDYAETMLSEVALEVAANRKLNPEFKDHKVTNGKHRMELTGGRLWRAAVASRRGGRSLSVDLVELDELREQTSNEAWNAIVPTTTTRPYSQVVCASNAGDIRSVVLRSQRDTAAKKITTGDTVGTKTALFEWSVPDDVDPKDPSFWHWANPAMGLLNDFTVETLHGYLESMEYTNLPGFMTEHLCRWVDAMEPGVLPAQAWAETTDPESRRARGSVLYAGLDVNYSRSAAFVGIAGRRADGKLHVEVAEGRPGTDWVVDWFAARRSKFAGVAVAKSGAPVSWLIPELVNAGVPVVEWAGLEVQRAAGSFFDQVNSHAVFHRPQPVLDRAAASTVARSVGDAWVFDRRNSAVDAAPLIACAAAAWCETHLPEEEELPDPRVHVWPDEDTIAAWEVKDLDA